MVTIKDSLKFKAIEQYSKKSKFTRLIHNIFFRKVIRPQVKLPDQNIKTLKEYQVSQNKIIRYIKIDVLDPFGFSIHDSTRHPNSTFKKAGNSIHVKTQEIIIQDLLLFQKYDRYDSLLIDESERLIRSQRYIHDVRIYDLPVSEESDSVDLYVRVMDIWSLVPAFRMSPSTVYLSLSDRNFIGLGHNFEGDIHHYRNIGDNVSRFSYSVPNIRNTFISAKFQILISDNMKLADSMEFRNTFYSPISSNPDYDIDNNNNLLRSLDISRSFYTPATKWAGGIFLGQIITGKAYIQNDTLLHKSVPTNIQDYWGARSWQISKGRTADGRITNFIFSLRMLKAKYPTKDIVLSENGIASRENLYFAGFGITSRKYVRDSYVFNYGKIEDVPAGRSFGITIGLTDVNRSNRMYFGIQAAWGDYVPKGYVSTHLEYGVLKGPDGFQQGVFKGQIDYFTPLFNVGSWKIRQFIRPAFTFGINRLPTENLSLSTRIEGFEKLNLPAIHMAVLSLQTQGYAPWNLIGFRFGPYIFSSFGMLGNASTGFSNSKLYSLFGIGILVKNNYLTFNTFQFSLTFYPYIPSRGNNIIKWNVYRTYNYRLEDFEISKPGVVEYR